MTQAEKNRTERSRDEWAIYEAQEEIRTHRQRRKANRLERKNKLDERNEALRNMLNRK